MKTNNSYRQFVMEKPTKTVMKEYRAIVIVFNGALSFDKNMVFLKRQLQIFFPHARKIHEILEASRILGYENSERGLTSTISTSGMR